MIDWRQWGHEPLALSVLVLIACAVVMIRGPLRLGFEWLPSPGFTLAGLVLAYLAIGPPWEQAGRYYLFSVQMAEQLLLIYGAAPLLVRGLSSIGGRTAARPWLPAGTLGVICGAVFVLGSGLCYLPKIHERALRSEWGLSWEHLYVLATGIIFWWPVLSRQLRLPALRFAPRMAYLLVVQVALAGAFTFLLMAEHAIYPTYEIAPRLTERLSPEEDQILAGVLLSAVGSVVLVTALGWAFFAWVRESEEN
ncbi:MAG TPA: cytochrome c oxidase assembly protein [Opitutaceae bacterium]|jgi:putative membrane protein